MKKELIKPTKKLWEKGYTLDPMVEIFTIGKDPAYDMILARYDCMGSMAHASMLEHVGLLTKREHMLIQKGLLQCLKEIESQVFKIETGSEDIHTSIENWLIHTIGSAGEKLHTGRSRNDQVLLDIRLYMRDALKDIMHELLACISVLLKQAKKYEWVAMPGRTHFQKAMLSSVGHLLGAYADMLLDNVQFAKSVYGLINQSPLGSASGYGVSLPIDREYVAKLLGFQSVQHNTLATQNSRIYYESLIINTCFQIMLNLSRIAEDLILFSTPEFGYFMLPKEFCSGSSLMPNKYNPDVLELIRARAARLVGYYQTNVMLIYKSPSGYQRDFQENKENLIESVRITKESLVIIRLFLEKIVWDANTCANACTEEIFATDLVDDLVKTGSSFRQAYRDIAQQSMRKNIDREKHMSSNQLKNLLKKRTQTGAPGNLGLAIQLKKVKKITKWLEALYELKPESLV